MIKTSLNIWLIIALMYPSIRAFSSKIDTNSMKEIQKEYDLKIPFGHDVGDKNTRNRSAVLHNYRTGGTPWFIFINQEGKVIFNDYHLNTEMAIEYLKKIG